MHRPFPYWTALLTAALATLIAGTITHAAEAILTAPAVIPACQLTLLDASRSTADRWEWICADPDVRLWHAADKKTLVLWCPSPRRLTLILKATDKTGTDAAICSIDVTGDAPQPVKPVTPPGPKPEPPKPEPAPPTPLPSGRFGLSQASHDEAAKLERKTLKADATLVAESLRGVRDKIAQGKLDTHNTRAVLQAITDANGKLPREVRTAWKPWGLWWGTTVCALHTAGKLASAQDWIDVLDETVSGLDAVR